MLERRELRVREERHPLAPERPRVIPRLRERAGAERHRRRIDGERGLPPLLERVPVATAHFATRLTDAPVVQNTDPFVSASAATYSTPSSLDASTLGAPPHPALAHAWIVEFVPK